MSTVTGQRKCHNGECDIDAKRTGKATGSEQLACGAPDPGSGCRSDGCQPTPHSAYPGGLPGEGSLRRCSRPAGPQADQRNSRCRGNRCGSPGSYQIRRGQPHPSQRVAERARGHRHRQDHPAAHPGQRRAEQSRGVQRQLLLPVPSIILAGSPPVSDRAAGPLRCGSWARRIPG